MNHFDDGILSRESVRYITIHTSSVPLGVVTRPLLELSNTRCSLSSLVYTEVQKNPLSEIFSQ